MRMLGTLRDYGWAYRQHLRAIGRRPEYVRNVDGHVMELTAALGGFQVDSLLITHIEGYAGQMREAGLAASYINHRLTVLSAVVRWAARTEGLDLPRWMASLTYMRPKLERRLVTTLTGEEQVRLLDVASPLLRLAMLFALRAGLRHQEILHLQQSDVSLVRRRITITAKPSVGWTPKTHEERTIPMALSLAGAFEAGLEGNKSWWLFPAADPIQPISTLAPMVAAAFRDACLHDPARRPGLHMLRRTWATEMLRAGCPLPDLMKMGGWTKLATVQKYLGTDMTEWQKMVDSLDF